jgi:hypothetical protein
LTASIVRERLVVWMTMQLKHDREASSAAEPDDRAVRLVCHRPLPTVSAGSSMASMTLP